jgi:hypothetical protein
VVFNVRTSTLWERLLKIEKSLATPRFWLTRNTAIFITVNGKTKNLLKIIYIRIEGKPEFVFTGIVGLFNYHYSLDVSYVPLLNAEISRP